MLAARGGSAFSISGAESKATVGNHIFLLLKSATTDVVCVTLLNSFSTLTREIEVLQGSTALRMGGDVL